MSDVAVVLALGANLGDATGTLDAAVAELGATPGIRIHSVSPYATTAPVGGPEQPDYLNAVVLAGTSLSPAALLSAGHAVEAAHGRARLVRWGARTLDIDLVAYGAPGDAAEVVIPEQVTLDAAPDAPRASASASRPLVLPHPRAYQRAFVLAPWAAVDPGARLRLPDGTVRPVVDLLAEAADRGDVRW